MRQNSSSARFVSFPKLSPIISRFPSTSVWNDSLYQRIRLDDPTAIIGIGKFKSISCLAGSSWEAIRVSVPRICRRMLCNRTATYTPYARAQGVRIYDTTGSISHVTAASTRQTTASTSICTRIFQTFRRFIARPSPQAGPAGNNTNRRISLYHNKKLIS